MGIVATTDRQAAWLLDGLQAAGLSVPGDLFLVGIGNDDLVCEAARPTLTSVDPHGPGKRDAPGGRLGERGGRACGRGGDVGRAAGGAGVPVEGIDLRIILPLWQQSERSCPAGHEFRNRHADGGRAIAADLGRHAEARLAAGHLAMADRHGRQPAAPCHLDETWVGRHPDAAVGLRRDRRRIGIEQDRPVGRQGRKPRGQTLGPVGRRKQVAAFVREVDHAPRGFPVGIRAVAQQQGDRRRVRPRGGPRACLIL
ncbi:MAG: substrate-binding domain-containing protein [Planctomycetia bacterium]